MTRQKQFGATCPKCGESVDDSTQFSNWIRQFQKPHPLSSSNMSVQNLDYITFHHFKDWFITIEEKRYAYSRKDISQLDTHGVLAQLLLLASGSTVKRFRGHSTPVEYRGHFLVVFEKTTPDDSLKALLRCGSLLNCPMT